MTDESDNSNSFEESLLLPSSDGSQIELMDMSHMTNETGSNEGSEMFVR